MVAPLGSTLGAAADGELLVLRSKLGIPSAANDQSGRLATAEELPVPRRTGVEPRLRYAETSDGGVHTDPRPRRNQEASGAICEMRPSRRGDGCGGART